MSPRLPPPLLALTPGNLRPEGFADLARRVSEAARGGLAGVLVREPALSDRATLDLLRRLRRRLPGGGWLGVHDRAHLARAGRVDGVHLGFRSLRPREARACLPGGVSLGLSAHAGDEARDWQDADLLFFGPVKETHSKAGLLAPTGFEALARAVERARVPLWAIGGLQPSDAPAALAAGARGLVVLSGVLLAEDPCSAAARYAEALAAASAAARAPAAPDGIAPGDPVS